MPDFEFERALMARGIVNVAGVDEAGRGPLAGPVAAAAVILCPSNLPDGLDDSKKLSAGTRERLFDVIMAKALAVGISLASVEEIDRLNIRAASLLAMRRAIAALALAPAHVLVDGNVIPPGLVCGAEAIVSGDSRCLSIAAASIIAKVTRDRLMDNLDRALPLYGFARHAGYPTALHREALASHGVTSFHRLSFRPVAAIVTRS